MSFSPSSSLISTSEIRIPRPECRIVRVKMYQEEIKPGIRSIHIKGRLDILGVEKIEVQFGEMTTFAKESVIVDLTEVELLSSAGLGMLIANANNLKSQGKVLILLRPQTRVERVIRIACLDELLPIEFDVTMALKRITAIRN